MRHEYKSEQQQQASRQQLERLPTTNCDQCQLIGATSCCQVSGWRLQPPSCVMADDLAESGQHWTKRSEQSGETIGRRCCRQHAVACRGFRIHHKSTTMIIDKLVSNASQQRCFRPLSLGLVTLTLLSLSVIVTPTPALFLSPLETKFLDSSCGARAPTYVRSTAYQYLMVLRCDIAPLYDTYLETYQKGKSKDEISKHPVAGGELAEFRKGIEKFFETADHVISQREFCQWGTFSELATLKEVVKNSQLLTLAYDLVAIELHTTCIGQTISKLPPVPHLVKDIVKIYIDGADKPLPDMNSRYEGDDMENDTPFDVDAAVQKNGSLEDVVGLSLTMFGRASSDQETAQEFRTTCKNFLIAIGQCWDPMEIMNSLVATDGSAIRQVNNYALRTLAPTKFADICSKISERA